MRLNPEIKYLTQCKIGGTVCYDLIRKLPDQKCMTQPDVLVVEFEGIYYVLKSCLPLESNDWHYCGHPVNLYELDFNEYTLQEVRNECNPSTNYSVTVLFAFLSSSN